MEGTAVNAANPEGRTHEIVVGSIFQEAPNETVEQPEVVDAEETFSQPYLIRRHNRDKRPGNLYAKHYSELVDFLTEWMREQSKTNIQKVLRAVEHFPYIDATKKEELDRIAALLLRSSIPEQGELATARAHLETTTTSGNEPSASMMEDDGDRKPAAETKQAGAQTGARTMQQAGAQTNGSFFERTAS